MNKKMISVGSGFAGLLALVVGLLTETRDARADLCGGTPFIVGCTTTNGGIGAQGNDFSSGGGQAVQGQSTNGTGVYGSAGTTGAGVNGSSSSGIGVLGQANTGSAPAVSAGAVGVGSGASVYGGYFESASSIGVVGLSGASTAPSVTAGVVGSGSGSSVYGGYFESASGQALYATAGSADAFQADYTGTGNHSGVKGTSSSTSSTSYGVWGDNTGGGPGVRGDGAYGVYGATTASAGGYGGYFSGGTGTTNTGVYGSGGSSSGYGVEGLSTTNSPAVYGTNSTGYGVQGIATGSTNYGVAGYADGSGAGVYGTSSTGYGGYFPGKLYGGTITCGTGCTSDIRLKKNVKPLKGALDELLQLKGVTFEWKNPSEHEDHTGTQEGVIAQDVGKVRPQWVHETPDTHMKTVDPDSRTMVALTVEAFREMKTKLDTDEAEIAKLKAHNVDNDARLDAIERGHPRAPKSAIGFNAPTGVGAFGIIVGGIAILSSRKKKKDERAS